MVILAVLTLARTAMGFHFQSVLALTSHLTTELGLSFMVLETLIGLYLIPGAVNRRHGARLILKRRRTFMGRLRHVDACNCCPWPIPISTTCSQFAEEAPDSG